MDADPQAEPSPDKHDAADSKPVNPSRWTPGESGNRAGRPRKGTAMTDILDRLSEMPIRKLRAMRDLTGKEANARMTILEGAKAKGQKDRAYLFDRLDGKPRQTVDVSDEGSEELYELVAEIGDAFAAFADPE